VIGSVVVSEIEHNQAKLMTVPKRASTAYAQMTEADDCAGALESEVIVGKQRAIAVNELIGFP
jgi:hypothetical protein